MLGRDCIEKMKWKRLFGISAILFFSLRQWQTKICPGGFTHLLCIQMSVPFGWLGKNLRKPAQRPRQAPGKPQANIPARSEEIGDPSRSCSSSVRFPGTACLMASVCDHLNGIWDRPFWGVHGFITYADCWQHNQWLCGEKLFWITTSITVSLGWVTFCNPELFSWKQRDMGRSVSVPFAGTWDKWAFWTERFSFLLPRLLTTPATLWLPQNARLSLFIYRNIFPCRFK